MSGGHFDYMHDRIRDLYEGEMHDDTLNALLIDFCKLLHDLDWWQSADTSEKDYRNTVQWFKNKWLGKERIVPVAEIKFDKAQLDEIVEKAKTNILTQIERPQGEWIDFAQWVAKEVLDDYFEDCSGAFAEIACRKLVKLGLVEVEGDVYKMKGGAE